MREDPDKITMKSHNSIMHYLMYSTLMNIIHNSGTEDDYHYKDEGFVLYRAQFTLICGDPREKGQPPASDYQIEIKDYLVDSDKHTNIFLIRIMPNDVDNEIICDHDFLNPDRGSSGSTLKRYYGFSPVVWLIIRQALTEGIWGKLYVSPRVNKADWYATYKKEQDKWDKYDGPSSFPFSYKI